MPPKRDWAQRMAEAAAAVGIKWPPVPDEDAQPDDLDAALDWLAEDIANVPDHVRRRELTARVNVMVTNPMLIAATVRPRYGRLYLHLMLQYLQDRPLDPAKSKEQAWYADRFMQAGFEIGAARKMAADLLGKPLGGVVTAHQRYGQNKGKAGRRRKE